MTMTVDPLLRARREVVECDAGWQVTDSDFVTTDKALAQAVAAELDLVEPLERTISREQARAQIDRILDEMERMLDGKPLDHARMDELRRRADVLCDHIRRSR